MGDGMENDTPVKVAVRQRPVETRDPCDIVVKYDTKSEKIILIDDRPYCFDYVIGPEVTQRELFAELIDPLVEKVKKGFNCTALAYGQTGTGKSYTMGMSTEVNDPTQAGVVRHCLWKLLEDINQFELSASFIEIYNERAFDLLAPDPLEPLMAKGFKFNGGTRKMISNIEDCNNILKLGISKRHVRPTVMNSQSSRSHVIFTIEMVSKNDLNPTRSYLNLVDLAGSEGVRRTGHIGVAMSEGVHINQGLLSIGKIVQAMSEGHKVIPYRDSVLGSVLQDSLNSNSYLTLLACISAKRVDLSETLSTIRFAQRAKQLKRTPRMNSILMELNLNKTRTKTPYDIKKRIEKINSQDPIPLKRLGPPASQENSINGGKLHKTFCTPGKVKRTAAQFNHTEIGLTPKEKEKAQRRVITTSTAVKTRIPTGSKPTRILNSTAQRESLFDHTIESWNISATTTLETIPSAPRPISYSPIINKCMEKFETVIENKMLSCTNKPISYSPIVQKCMEKFETVLENKMIKLLETIQKTKGMVTNIPENSSAVESQDLVDEHFSEEDNTSPILNSRNGRCQLFTTSSPVFKVPEVPNKRKSNFNDIQYSNESSSIEPKDLSIPEQSIDEQTVRHVRRSRRIFERTLRNDSMHDNSSIIQLDSSKGNSKGIKHCSIRVLRERRKSTRIAAKLEEHPKKSKPKMKSRVNNKIISSYFNEPSSSNSSQQHSLKKHKAAILALLNNGSMKELQILPQIGQKMAFQLITHRTLHGKFKSIAQLEKLPIWRGNAWERFAQANILI